MPGAVLKPSATRPHSFCNETDRRRRETEIERDRERETHTERDRERERERRSHKPMPSTFLALATFLRNDLPPEAGPEQSE